MSHTHLYTDTVRFREDTETSILTTTTATITSDVEKNADISIANGADGTQIDLVVDISKTASFYMLSDQDVTVWCRVNDTGSGTPASISLSAGIPYYWHNALGTTNPFTTDCNVFFVDNASGYAAAFKIRSIEAA